jgi:hypothetical protein
MTAPKNFMTYCGPIDRLRHRAPARNAGLRSRTGFNTRVISAKIAIRHPFHLYVSCSPLHPSRLAPAQPLQRYSAPIEIP